MEEEAIDRILTEYIIRLGTSVNASQMRIDGFIDVASLTLSPEEIAGIVETTGVIRVELEAMENALIKAFKQSIVSASQSGRGDAQREKGPTVFYTWQVESARPCPDCISRSGQTETYAYWEAVGLPQTGTTICGTNCKCVLVEEI